MKTRRLSDYMAHLTLSPYFLDTVRHLTLYIVLPAFLNILDESPRVAAEQPYISLRKINDFIELKKSITA